MKSSLALVLFAPAASVPQLQGSVLRSAQIAALQDAATHTTHKVAAPWTDTAFYVMLVVLVLAIIGLIVKFVKGPPRPVTLKDVTQAQMEIKLQEQELEASLKAIRDKAKAEDVEAGAAPEEDDTVPIDYEAALRTFAQVVAQTVGPKVAKGQAVKNILETRVQTLTKQTKTFVLDELHGTAGDVLSELGAEEAMLLLDPARAVQGNFPPLAVLLAGLFSPVVLALTALNHLAQALLHFLPILCLCIASLYIDEGQPCPGIPTIFPWLYAHCVVGGLLLLSHFGQVIKVIASRSCLTTEMQAKGTQLKELAKQCKDGDISKIREMFIQTCVMVQKALQQEDNVRRSIFAKLIGFFTLIWIGLTIWTFVIVLAWTLVPGTIAFHHTAAEAAGGHFCGAWFTVFTARLCCIIGVIFLMINIGTVSTWFADSAKFNPAFADSVLAEAKKVDDQAGGIPVVQTLVKAFVLRGSSETLELQMATASMDRSKLQSEKYVAEKELAAVESQLATVTATHDGLTKQLESMPGRSFVSIKPKTRDLAIPDGAGAGPSVGQRASEIAGAALSEASVQAQQTYDKANEQLAALQKQADSLKEQGKELGDELQKQLANIDIEAQKAQAMALAQRTREELQHMVELIMQKMQEIRESEQFQGAMREVQERAAQAKKIAEEKMKLLQDSELGRAIAAGDTEALKKMGYESVEIAQKKAKEIAEEAMKVAEEFSNSELGQAIASGDADALKKLGYDSLEVAQAKAQELVEQGKAAAAQAKQLVDGSELGRAITSGDTEALKKLGYENLEEAKKKAQELVDEGKKVADQARKQLEDSEFGKALESGDLEALKKYGCENLEVAKKKAQEMVEQAQQAASNARALVDDSELGRALAAGDTEALKKMGYEGVEQAKKRAEEFVEEGKAAAERAQKSMEDSELGKAILTGDEETLKKLGYANLEAAQKKAQELVEQGQQAAAQARQSLEDTELGKAIAAGDVKALKEMGCQSVEAAKKKAEEAVKQGQEAAAKARKEFEDAMASNDMETLKKLGCDSVEEAKKKMDAAVEEAAAAAAKAVAS